MINFWIIPNSVFDDFLLRFPKWNNLLIQLTTSDIKNNCFISRYVVRRLDRFNEKSGNTLSLFTPSAVRHYDFVLTPITLSPHSYSYEQQSDEEKDAFKVPVVTHRGIQTSKKFISYVPSTLYISLRRRSVNNVVPLVSYEFKSHANSCAWHKQILIDCFYLKSAKVKIHKKRFV